MDQNRRNRELHNLLGLPPQGHDVQGETCDHYYETWPDYLKNPWLVLKEMMKREDCFRFLDSLFPTWTHSRDAVSAHLVDYILDTTGLLAMRAIEWLEKQTEGGGENV